MELAKAELQVEERQAAKDQHGEVGDEEGAAAVVVANVREPPHVSQINGESNDGEEELDLLAPGLSFLAV